MKILQRISFLCGILILMASSSVSALPPEHQPLKPRVPTQERAQYRHLKPSMYDQANLASPEIVEEGRKIYQRICVNCHGEHGQGNGTSAAFLPVLPRNFTNCFFQNKRSDGELFYVIKFGSWPMPPMIPSISEDEAWQSIAYIRTFCEQ